MNDAERAIRQELKTDIAHFLYNRTDFDRIDCFNLANLLVQETSASLPPHTRVYFAKLLLQGTNCHVVEKGSLRFSETPSVFGAPLSQGNPE